jgi:ribose transport system permease protein
MYFSIYRLRGRVHNSNAMLLASLAGRRIRNQEGLSMTVAALLVAALVVYLSTGVNFFKATNILNMARGFSLLGITAIGQTVVIIGGGLDLSVAEVISTSNVFAATFMAGKDALFIPVTLLALVLGALVGFLNGALVTKRNVPAFVATLGTSIVLRGARLMWTQGLPQGHIPDNLNALGVGASLGVPNLFYVFLACAILMAVVLRRMGFGRRLYAVGTNRSVATLSGVRSDRVIILSYVISAVCAAFVGVLLGGYTGMSDQKIGEGYDLDSIAVAVLGGAAIGGGSGSVGGTILGAVIILVLTNLSLLMGFPIQSQMVIKGGVIILALWLTARRKVSA